MIRRYWRHPRFKIIIICFLIVLNFGMILNGYHKSKQEVQPAFAGQKLSDRFIEQYRPQWSEVLSLGIPGMNGFNKKNNVQISSVMNIGRFYRETILFISSVDITDLRSVVSTEIPLLAGLKIGPPIVSAMSLPNFPKFNPQNLIAGDSKPLVGIYHTHTSESFIPSSGVSHTRGGQKGEIVEIGAAMKKHLETNGIQAIHSENVHDYPSFMKAYGASEITAKKMLEENPSIQMLFDIHRDAEKRDNATVMVNGLPTAKILIVVATGQPDLVQPNWQQNHAFAKLIDAKLNAHFPGLSRGIQLVDWRFNQQLHPRALLFEIGCQENSKEEAQKSAELLSDVIAEIIAENKGQ